MSMFYVNVYNDYGTQCIIYANALINAIAYIIRKHECLILI